MWSLIRKTLTPTRAEEVVADLHVAEDEAEVSEKPLRTAKMQQSLQIPLKS